MSDDGLVCEPLGNPHYHHRFGVTHVHFFSYLAPNIRHHMHHTRVCHHAHTHCHWELGAGGSIAAEDAAGEGAFADGGDGFGGGFLGYSSGSGLIGFAGTGQPHPIPELPTVAMMALGFAALIWRAWRRA
jgi:hypothetical protein